jgi:hypothetical protein
MRLLRPYIKSISVSQVVSITRAIDDKRERGVPTSGAGVSGGCVRGGCGSSASSAKDEIVDVYVKAATHESKYIMPGNAVRARMFLRLGDNKLPLYAVSAPSRARATSRRPRVLGSRP